MNTAIEAPASAPPLAPLHRRVTGLATVAAAAVYLATDAVELAFDFSPAQLWATFLAFSVFPAAMIGLYALQAGLLGLGLSALRSDESGRDA
jgi:hypothetical protein